MSVGVNTAPVDQVDQVSLNAIRNTALKQDASVCNNVKIIDKNIKKQLNNGNQIFIYHVELCGQREEFEVIHNYAVPGNGQVQIFARKL